MSIWFWIIAAWIITYIALGKRRVQPKHLIWMLLPVDMYGVTLFGITVKPYMIFCLLLLLKRLAEDRTKLNYTSPWMLRGPFLILLCVVVTVINCGETSSVMATFMMLVVWGCSLIYLSECDRGCKESICHVLQATGIGYGLVFVIGYVVMQFFPEIPGLMASERSLPGMYMQNANVVQGIYVSTYRLRGFTIDPNTMVGTFLYCTVISLLRLVQRKGGFREILGLILSTACVLYSGSRMGLICLILCAVISLWAGYYIDSARTKQILLGVVFALIAGFVITLVTGNLQTVLTSVFLNYSNRSSLSDDYGRLTIWQEAVSIWVEQGLFLGIGTGQMQYYTSMARSCHNSWLEMLCAWGTPMGGVMLCHFAAPVLGGVRYLRVNRSARKDLFFWTMLLGTVGVMVSLSTVDNITYSYLWFGAAMLASICAGNWEEK